MVNITRDHRHLPCNTCVHHTTPTLAIAIVYDFLLQGLDDYARGNYNTALCDVLLQLITFEFQVAVLVVTMNTAGDPCVLQFHIPTPQTDDVSFLDILESQSHSAFEPKSIPLRCALIKYCKGHGGAEHYNAIGTSRSTTAGNGAGQGGGEGPASGTASQKRPASPNTGKQTAPPTKKLAIDQYGALTPNRAKGVLSLLQAINAGLQEASVLQPTIDGYADQVSAIWRTVLVAVAGNGKTGGQLDVDGTGARAFRKLVDGLRTQGVENAGVFFSKCHSSAHTLFAFVRNAATSAGTKSRIEWQCAVCKTDTLHAVGRWDETKVRAHLLSPGHLHACREWIAYARTKEGAAASFAFAGIERSGTIEVSDPHKYCLSLITYSLVHTMQPFTQAPVLGELVSTICRYILSADLHNLTPAQLRRLVNNDNPQASELLLSLGRLRSVCAVKKPMPCSRRTATDQLEEIGDVLLMRTVKAVNASECFSFSMDATKDIVSRCHSNFTLTSIVTLLSGLSLVLVLCCPRTVLITSSTHTYMSRHQRMVFFVSWIPADRFTFYQQLLVQADCSLCLSGKQILQLLLNAFKVQV